MAEAPAVDRAAADAKRRRATRGGATALLLVVGVVGFPGPLAMGAFAAVAVLWWGKALGMVGLFGLATAVAFFATRRPVVPTDDLAHEIGPPAAPLAAPARAAPDARR